MRYVFIGSAHICVPGQLKGLLFRESETQVPRTVTPRFAVLLEARKLIRAVNGGAELEIPASSARNF